MGPKSSNLLKNGLTIQVYNMSKSEEKITKIGNKCSYLFIDELYI